LGPRKKTTRMRRLRLPQDYHAAAKIRRSHKLVLQQFSKVRLDTQLNRITLAKFAF